MDAQAYLIKHGWSGPGNPLNPNKRPGAHSGLGLTRPLLVSRKANNHGVGKKTTKDPTNQWWLRGFEDALKGVGNDSFEATSARGDGLAGTLEGSEKKKDESSSSISKSKRKRENEDDGLDRKARKLAKAARKVEKAERKEGRRVKRAAKAEKKEKKMAEKLAKKALKEKKRTASEEDYPTPTSIDQESDQTGTTTETDKAVLRLEDKAAKKAKKESKKAKSIGSDTVDEDQKKKSKKEKKDKKEAEA
ncbi:uncharacterized protein N7500_004398 [Penicillium coprophilum]|uniref:uncharacterized protein n=1 Tax=Penicillium coprophilum TaxID=36646 RepID=UPI002396FA77|nr:uncharacterized protein N7500_004398 [Penicillium coprophilum]KAJ5162568.1 hypothetical protein N7500_004398 [Penicillium coprophilum]